MELSGTPTERAIQNSSGVLPPGKGLAAMRRASLSDGLGFATTFSACVTTTYLATPCWFETTPEFTRTRVISWIIIQLAQPSVPENLKLRRYRLTPERDNR